MVKRRTDIRGDPSEMAVCVHAGGHEARRLDCGRRLSEALASSGGAWRNSQGAYSFEAGIADVQANHSTVPAAALQLGSCVYGKALVAKQSKT